MIHLGQLVAEYVQQLIIVCAAVKTMTQTKTFTTTLPANPVKRLVHQTSHHSTTQGPSYPTEKEGKKMAQKWL